MHKPTRQVSTLLSISSHDIACRMVRRSGPHERYLSERVLTRRVDIDCRRGLGRRRAREHRGGGFIEVESRRRYQPLFRFPARGTVPRNSYSRRLKFEEIGRMSNSTGLIVFAVLYLCK